MNKSCATCALYENAPTDLPEPAFPEPNRTDLIIFYRSGLPAEAPVMWRLANDAYNLSLLCEDALQFLSYTAKIEPLLQYKLLAEMSEARASLSRLTTPVREFAAAASVVIKMRVFDRNVVNPSAEDLSTSVAQALRKFEMCRHDRTSAGGAGLPVGVATLHNLDRRLRLFMERFCLDNKSARYEEVSDGLVLLCGWMKYWPQVWLVSGMAISAGDSAAEMSATHNNIEILRRTLRSVPL